MRISFAICSLLIFLIIASCGKRDKETFDNSNDILIILYDTLTQPISHDFPLLPDGYSYEDSLKTLSTYNRIKEERIGKIKKVAIPAYLSSGKNFEVENLKIDKEFKTLILKLEFLEEQPLDLSLFKSLRKDSIIEYKENLLDPLVSDYLKFDLLISFSRIAFNDSNNKAVVIGTSSTSGLAGHSAIYLFEKKDGKWSIVKSLGLWIS